MQVHFGKIIVFHIDQIYLNLILSNPSVLSKESLLYNM